VKMTTVTFVDKRIIQPESTPAKAAAGTRCHDT
jgi:hypothetical protein